MRVSHPSPAAGNRQENRGGFLDKGGLLLEGQHEISVAFGLRRERSEFAASYTKTWESGVRILFDAFEAQGNPAKIGGGHGAIRHGRERVW